MNKPSIYQPYWRKLQLEFKLVVETPVPARFIKAIIKRKHICGVTGRIRATTQLTDPIKLDAYGQVIYIVHFNYTPACSIAIAKYEESRKS